MGLWCSLRASNLVSLGSQETSTKEKIVFCGKCSIFMAQNVKGGEEKTKKPSIKTNRAQFESLFS